MMKSEFRMQKWGAACRCLGVLCASVAIAALLLMPCRTAADVVPEELGAAFAAWIPVRMQNHASNALWLVACDADFIPLKSGDAWQGCVMSLGDARPWLVPGATLQLVCARSNALPVIPTAAATDPTPDPNHTRGVALRYNGRTIVYRLPLTRGYQLTLPPAPIYPTQ